MSGLSSFGLLSKASFAAKCAHQHDAVGRIIPLKQHHPNQNDHQTFAKDEMHCQTNTWDVQWSGILQDKQQAGTKVGTITSTLQ
eukprot:1050680-Amphidinium_carterae.1